jgi:hypothetical protein
MVAVNTGEPAPDTEELPLEFEKLDEDVKTSAEEFRVAVRPFILMQGAGFLLGAVSIFLYLLWP